MFIDAHCHLSELPPEEAQNQILRARDAGVSRLVLINSRADRSDIERTLQIVSENSGFVAGIAVHPHEAEKVHPEDLDWISDLIRTNPRIKAVGEIGLDYHYMNSPKQAQRDVLRKFIRIAHEVKKPVIIHDRDAAFECVDILKEENAEKVSGMVHCFTGTLEIAKRYLDLGFYVSFTGIITFKNAHDLREIVKYVPLERMMIETDSPYLAPVPHRGKKNEPAFVTHVAECVAEIKNVTIDEAARVTTENAKKFFRI